MNHIISPSSAQWFIPIASGSHGQRASLLSSVLDFCLDPNFFRLMRKITKETSVRTNTGLRMLALAWPLLSHYQFSSGAQSCPTLWPHRPQYARLPCPSPTPRACSNSCPSCQWCHPTISSSVIPFYSYLQSFPASGSLMYQLFASGGQSILRHIVAAWHGSSF